MGRFWRSRPVLIEKALRIVVRSQFWSLIFVFCSAYLMILWCIFVILHCLLIHHLMLVETLEYPASVSIICMGVSLIRYKFLFVTWRQWSFTRLKYRDLIVVQIFRIGQISWVYDILFRVIIIHGMWVDLRQNIIWHGLRKGVATLYPTSLELILEHLGWSSDWLVFILNLCCKLRCCIMVTHPRPVHNFIIIVIWFVNQSRSR